jgi:hypothetical protein
VSVVFDPYCSLSLPLERPNEPTRIVFVPLDHNVQCMAIPFPPSPSPEDVNKVMSAALGRRVRCVVGLKMAAYSISWTTQELGVDTPYAGDVYHVWEIEEGNYMWVACMIDIGGTSGFGPVLVPIADETVGMLGVVQAAERVLAWVWDSRTPALSEEADAWLRQVSLPPRGWEMLETQRFRAEFVQSWATLARAHDNRDMSSYVAYLKVNASFASQFNIRAVAAKAVRWAAAMAEAQQTRDRPPITVQRCLEMLSEPEVLDEQNKWFCRHCKKHVCANKKLDVWSVPPLLLIQLKRFIGGAYSTTKINTDVAFPDILDMSQYVTGPVVQGLRYRLYAVSEHAGSLEGGHYTAHALVRPLEGTRGDGQWYSFNDATVEQSQVDSAHTSLAYVLFYERI